MRQEQKKLRDYEQYYMREDRFIRFCSSVVKLYEERFNSEIEWIMKLDSSLERRFASLLTVIVGMDLVKGNKQSAMRLYKWLRGASGFMHKSPTRGRRDYYKYRLLRTGKIRFAGHRMRQRIHDYTTLWRVLTSAWSKLVSVKTPRDLLCLRSVPMFDHLTIFDLAEILYRCDELNSTLDSILWRYQGPAEGLYLLYFGKHPRSYGEIGQLKRVAYKLYRSKKFKFITLQQAIDYLVWRLARKLRTLTDLDLGLCFFDMESFLCYIQYRLLRGVPIMHFMRYYLSGRISLDVMRDVFCEAFQ